MHLSRLHNNTLSHSGKQKEKALYSNIFLVFSGVDEECILLFYPLARR